MPPESNHIHQSNEINEQSSMTRRNTPIATTSSETYSRPGRRKNAAFHEFIAGLTLYCGCIFLPSLPQYIYFAFQWIKSYARAFGERLLWYIWVIWRFSILVMERWGWKRELGYDDDVETSDMSKRVRLRSFLRKYLSTSTAASLWEEFNQQQIRDKESPPLASSTSYTWGFGWSSSSYHPAIAMVLCDIQILTMLAVTLAIIRIWFVHMLVPEYLAPQRLEAFTRCKSSHLLSSSSYKFDGEASLERCARQQRECDESSGWYDRLMRKASFHWYRLRPTVRRALGHEPTTRYNDLNANALQFHGSNSTPDLAQELFSAPRYATAVFRLMFTSISCFTAYYIFHSAIFWPRQVFGSHANASTKNCWDLSGSVVFIGALDEDYDNLNSELKYFFLAQAAYQLHSLCFHLVSMGLLLLYGEDSKKSLGRLIQPPSQQQMQRNKSRRLLSMKTSMQSYLRPMVEHFVVLCLLAGAYLFSGLRRLASVGIFSLEFSSVFLQLLQVCIYAPEGSWLKQPKVVTYIHRLLTVPTFIYCRLFVLPLVVWHSAAFESGEWLDQIEMVLSKGYGQYIYYLFNGLLALIFALNLILFRRLLFHPHLRQIRHQQRHGSQLVIQTKLANDQQI